MLAAAVVPHPPLLVPALAAGRAPELAGLLAACDAGVADLLAVAPQVIVLVGAGERTTRHLRNAWGTFAGFGVDVAVSPVPGVEPAALPRLPLPLTIGRWLLERAGWRGEVVCQEVAAGATQQQCADVARGLVGELPAGAAWLALADGDDLTNHPAVMVLAAAQDGARRERELVQYDDTPYDVRYRVAGWRLVP
ncbi:hypothetical protein ACIB24_11135 [Spongisporangium articulatum]|uniref:Uncharacterized protein n=1 Tax=Spongisporangium articulatum TaxID=3362603 RepID=A0ABW8ANT9_9ACTN